MIGDRMPRARIARVLLLSSRVLFGLTFLLAMMTPAWERGTFTHLPICRVRISGQTFSIGALTLLPVLSAATWVGARLLDRPRRRWRWGAAHIAVPVFCFAGLALARIWPVHVAHIAVIVAVAVIVFLGTFLYVLQEWPARWSLALVALLVAFQGAIAIAQFVKQDSVGLSWLGEGWLDPDGQGVSVIEAAGRRWLRAYGLSPHPNVLGGYLSMGILICLGEMRRVSARGRLCLGSAVLLGSLGLVFSFSRSAWLATVVGLGYVALIVRPWQAVDWRRPGTKARMAVLASLLMVGAIVFGVSYGELFIARFFRLASPLEASSIQERLVDYRQAWSLIRTVPLKGVGSGYYIAALWSGVGEDRPPGFRKVHSAPLLAFAELGVGGIVLWLSLLLLPPLVLARDRRYRQMAGATGWAAAFLSAAVLGLFDSYLYIPSTWWPALFIGLLAGVWARRSRGAADEGE